MSSAVFPQLPGMTFPIGRSPIFATTTQTSVSGLETRIALQSFPRWKWDIPFSLLRSALSYGEMQELVGFFNGLYGSWDSFLYQDVDDNTVTGQAIATGDGVTTVFQLVRTFGGFTEPMLAPNVVSSIYLNGVRQTTGVSNTAWGTSNSQGPGVLIFTSAPASGVVITADFSYYWPCRMQTDSLDLSLFMSGFYDLKKFSFISVKN